MAMLPTGVKWPPESPPVYNFYNNIDNSNKCGCCCKCGGTTPTPEPEWTEYDGGWADTPDATYEANKDRWLDGGQAGSALSEEVNGGEA